MSYRRVLAKRLPLRPRPPRTDIDTRPEGETRLAPAERALIERRHADRLEARTLSPPRLDGVRRRFAAERVVEENLARGRFLTAYEARRASDMRSYRRDHGRVRFPEPAPAFAALLSPPRSPASARSSRPSLLPAGWYAPPARSRRTSRSRASGR